jgi:hypothetical protein
MSLDLWPSDVYGDEGSPPENIDAICEAIHDATKGFGTNEKYVHDVTSGIESPFFYVRKCAEYSRASYPLCQCYPFPKCLPL